MLSYRRSNMKEKSIVIFIVLLFISTMATTANLLYERNTKNKIMNEITNGFYLNGDDLVVMEYGGNYKDEGFISTIFENQSPKDIKINNTVDDSKVGEYKVTYTLTYKNQTKSLVRTVKIIDNVPPTLKLDCDKDQYVVKDSSLKNCKYTVTDNYDKELENNVQVISNVNLYKKGDYKVEYIATDSSGNISSQIVNVHVRDKADLNYIVVYLSKQKLYYYENKRLVLSTPITSGRDNLTKPGNFKIWNKVRNTELKGKDYVSKVKYWLAYNGNSFGIHDASWRKRFGTMDYKWVGSHGCINVPTKAMKKLYNMVEIGTPVYIKK